MKIAVSTGNSRMDTTWNLSELALAGCATRYS